MKAKHVVKPVTQSVVLLCLLCVTQTYFTIGLLLLSDNTVGYGLLELIIAKCYKVGDLNLVLIYISRPIQTRRGSPFGNLFSYELKWGTFL